MATKRRPERIAMIVKKGALVPRDEYAAGKLRERGYHIGDNVFVEIKKPRNPRFHALAHAFGMLLVDNLEPFEHLDAHSALKRLQLEAGVGCDEIAYEVPGYGMITQRVPRSLSFESMDDGEFHEVFSGLCRYVATRYWPTCSEDEVMDMATAAVVE